jgi:hypothetical protein
MKAYWGSGGIASRIFFTSALDGGVWSVSRPGHFTPRERALDTHWIGGWVGPRAVLDAVVKRNVRKVKVSLCLTKHHAMKAYWGVKV